MAPNVNDLLQQVKANARALFPRKILLNNSLEVVASHAKDGFRATLVEIQRPALPRPAISPYEVATGTVSTASTGTGGFTVLMQGPEASAWDKAVMALFKAIAQDIAEKISQKEDKIEPAAKQPLHQDRTLPNYIPPFNLEPPSPTLAESTDTSSSLAVLTPDSSTSGDPPAVEFDPDLGLSRRATTSRASVLPYPDPPPEGYELHYLQEGRFDGKYIYVPGNRPPQPDMTPPPVGTKIGSKHAPWLELTEFEIGHERRRRRGKVPPDWVPNKWETMQILLSLNRGPGYKAIALENADEAGKEILDEKLELKKKASDVQARATVRYQAMSAVRDALTSYQELAASRAEPREWDLLARLRAESQADSVTEAGVFSGCEDPGEEVPAHAGRRTLDEEIEELVTLVEKATEDIARQDIAKTKSKKKLRREVEELADFVQKATQDIAQNMSEKKSATKSNDQTPSYIPTKHLDDELTLAELGELMLGYGMKTSKAHRGGISQSSLSNKGTTKNATALEPFEAMPKVPSDENIPKGSAAPVANGARATRSKLKSLGVGDITSPDNTTTQRGKKVAADPAPVSTQSNAVPNTQQPDTFFTTPGTEPGTLPGAPETTPATKKTKTTECTDPTNASNTLFVGNLSWNVDEEWLRREFQQYGEIVGCRLIYWGGSRIHKGFGYVEFANAADAAKAKAEKNGAELAGRILNIDFTEPRGNNPIPGNHAPNPDTHFDCFAGPWTPGPGAGPMPASPFTYPRMPPPVPSYTAPALFPYMPGSVGQTIGDQYGLFDDLLVQPPPSLYYPPFFGEPYPYGNTSSAPLYEPYNLYRGVPPATSNANAAASYGQPTEEVAYDVTGAPIPPDVAKACREAIKRSTALLDGPPPAFYGTASLDDQMRKRIAALLESSRKEGLGSAYVESFAGDDFMMDSVMGAEYVAPEDFKVRDV